MDRKKNRGFSLIELMVVLIILALLVTVIAPNVIGKSDDAKVTKARADIGVLESLLDQYYLNLGQYPTNEEGLDALYKAPDGAGERWKGPYTKKPIPLDPWGEPYNYASPGTHTSNAYEIWSYGRDRQEGGEGYDADITSWTAEDET